MDLRSAWRVEDGHGRDLTDKLRPYFKQLRVVDRAGRKSDEVSLGLGRGQAPLDVPELSKALRPYMGETSSQLVDLGIHYVTDYGLRGMPEVLQITARPFYWGADKDGEIEAPARAQETRSATYAPTTLTALAKTIADRLGIGHAVDTGIGGFIFDVIEQSRESDVAFIGRAAEIAGGIAKINQGTLVVGDLHTQQSYGNAAQMPNVNLDLDRMIGGFDFNWSAKRQPGSVRAHWSAPKQGLAGTYDAGTDEPVLDLKKVYGSFNAAQRAAEARLKRIREQKRGGTITLTRLNLSLWVGSTVQLGAGWHPEARGSWTVSQATHTISADSGGSTSVSVERNENNG